MMIRQLMASPRLLVQSFRNKAMNHVRKYTGAVPIYHSTLGDLTR